MPQHSAAELAHDLETGNKSAAVTGLAENYLSMSPTEFKSVIKDMDSATKQLRSSHVYSTDKPKSGLQVYIHDGYISDTRLFAVKRDFQPQSKPLPDQKLEQVARNFNNMLNDTRDRYSFDSNMAAGKALISFAEALPRKEEALLLQRAQEINLEMSSKELPGLQIIFSDRDGTGVPDRLQRAVLNVQDYCVNHGMFEGSSRYDLYTPPGR